MATATATASDTAATAPVSDPETGKTIRMIFQVQGTVPPGFTTSHYPGFENARVLAFNDAPKNPDSGGQTEHVLQVADTLAREAREQNRDESVYIIAMSGDPESTEPELVTHGDNGARILYLPFNVYREAAEAAGADLEDWKHPLHLDRDVAFEQQQPLYLVKKETAMAYGDHLFPRMGQAALEAVAQQEAEVWRDPNTRLDLNGHYIDGGMAALKAVDELNDAFTYQGQPFAGEASTRYTSHTLGANKLGSTLQRHLDQVASYLDQLPSNGARTQGMQHPWITAQQAVLDRIHEYREAGDVREALQAALQQDEAGREDFLQALHKQGMGDETLKALQAEITDHGIAALDREFSFDQRLRYESAASLSQFNQVYSVSPCDKERLGTGLTNVYSTPDDLVVNGYNPDIFSIEKRQELRADPDGLRSRAQDILAQAHDLRGDRDQQQPVAFTEPTLLAACRPDPRKNVPQAVKAFIDHAKQHPEDRSNLVAAWHKPDPEPANNPEFLNAMVREIQREDAENPGLGLVDRIFLVPKLAPEEIMTLYSAFDKPIGVGSSVYEPFGISLVEALAAGLPTIASNGYGAARFVDTSVYGPETSAENRGIQFFPVKDKNGNAVPEAEQRQSLSEAIKTISDDYTGFQARVQNDIVPFVTKNNWREMADQYLKAQARLDPVHIAEAATPRTLFVADLGALVPEDKNQSAAPSLTTLCYQLAETARAGGVTVVATHEPLKAVQGDTRLDFRPDYVIAEGGEALYRRNPKGDYAQVATFAPNTQETPDRAAAAVKWIMEHEQTEQKPFALALAASNAQSPLLDPELYAETPHVGLLVPGTNQELRQALQPLSRESGNGKTVYAPQPGEDIAHQATAILKAVTNENAFQKEQEETPETPVPELTLPGNGPRLNEQLIAPIRQVVR